MPLNEYENLVANDSPNQNNNEYFDVVEQDSVDSGQQIKNTFNAVKDKDPDQHSQFVDMSNKTKLPVDVVERNYEDIKKQQAIEDNDYESLVKENPNLSNWLTDPNNAAVGKDDLDSLKKIDQGASTLLNKNNLPSFIDEAWDTVYPKNMVSAFRTGYNDLQASAGHLGALYGSGGQFTDEEIATWVAEKNKKSAELRSQSPDYANEYSAIMQKQGADVNAAAAEFGEGAKKFQDGKILEAMKSWTVGGGLYVGEALDQIASALVRPRGLAHSSMQSMAHSLPGMATGYLGGQAGASIAAIGAAPTVAGEVVAVPAGFLTGYAVGAFAGSVPVEIGGWMNQAMQQAGYDITNPKDVLKAYRDPEFMARAKAEAERKGVTTALVDAVISRYAGHVTTKAGVKPSLLSKTLQGAKGVATEMTGEFASEAAGQAAAYKDLSKVDWGDAINEGVSSVGSSIMSVGTYTEGFKAIREQFSTDVVQAAKEVHAKTGEALKATHDAEALKSIGEAVKESKTSARLPEAIKSLVEMAGGDEKGKVYFQSKEWDDYWNVKGVSPAEAAANIMDDGGRAYYQAKSNDSHLAINLSDYVSKVGPTDDYEGLLGAAKMREDGMSLKEANEHLKALPEVMGALSQEAQAHVEVVDQGAEEVRQNVESQLIESGFTPETAAQYSQVYKSTFDTLSKRTGIPAKELFDKYGLKIQRFDVSQAGEGASLKTLSQSDKWKSEGYSISANYAPTFDESGEIVGEDTNKIEVFSQSKNDDVGHAVFRIEDGYLIPDDSSGDNAVYVKPEHRRKGIAAEMYAEAERLTGLKVKPSSWQTDLGKALWNDANKPFGDKTFNQAQVSPLGFFSQVEDTIDKMDFKSMPAKDLAARISNVQGIKKEELEWVGLIDWLNTQEGKVTKEDVLKFVREHGVHVEQVVLSNSYVNPVKQKTAEDLNLVENIEWSEELMDIDESQIIDEQDYILDNLNDYFSDSIDDSKEQWMSDERDALEEEFTNEDGTVDEEKLQEELDKKWDKEGDGYLREVFKDTAYDMALENLVNSELRESSILELTTREGFYGSDANGWYTHDGDYLRGNLEEAKIKFIEMLVDKGLLTYNKPLTEDNVEWGKVRSPVNDSENKNIYEELSAKVLSGDIYQEEFNGVLDQIKTQDKGRDVSDEEKVSVAKNLIWDKISNGQIDGTTSKVYIQNDSFEDTEIHGIRQGDKFVNMVLYSPSATYDLDATNFEDAIKEANKQLVDDGDMEPSATKSVSAEPTEINIYTPQGKSKWHKYIMSGDAENYREILLTLPKIGPDKFQYTTHFDQKNILAHIRLSDRVTPDGKKMLFIEEIQSDWHQQGREKGYKLKSKRTFTTINDEIHNLILEYGGKLSLAPKEIQNKVIALEKERDIAEELENKQENAVPDAPFKNTEAWATLAMKRVMKMAIEQGYDAVGITPGEVHVDRWGTDSISWIKKSNDPSNWKLIKIPDENPYGTYQLVDSNGKPQELYKTEKEAKAALNEIKNKPKEEGFLVGSVEQVGGNADGQNIEEMARRRGQLLERQGEFVSSKEELHKIIAETLNRERNERSLESLTDALWKQMQTQESGVKSPRKEGMEFFYDNLIPKKAAPAALKGLDKSAKVGVGKLETATEDYKEHKIDKYRVVGVDGDIKATGETEEQAKKNAESFPGSKIYKPGEKIDMSKDVWQILITDQMRETAKNGQVLFQGGNDPRGQIRIGNASMKIDLLNKADLSTFLHESGHFYLEVLGDLALDPNIDQGIKEDYRTILNYLGVQTREEITTEHHEKFARSFEAYLMEGKAPSSELRKAFAKFRTWLVSVYRQIKNLNVELTDEVRGVFDRLLATEQEINEAQDESKFNPLFADPQSVGMNAIEAAKYSDSILEAKTKAEEELSQKLMDEWKREDKAWWKEESATVRAGVEAEVNNNPTYIAMSVLQKGTMPDGSEVQPHFKDIKLNKQALIDDFGETILKRLPRPYVYSEDGIHHDIAAQMFGFSSGDEMIQNIANIQKKEQFVKNKTEAIMKDKYGDLLNDPSLKDEAVKAVHNEKRTELMRKELEHLVSDSFAKFKGLVKKINKPIPPISEVRHQAEQNIAQKKVRDIKPIVYKRAENKAAKESMNLFLNGDFEGAFDMKLKQLMNAELYRAAVNAKETAEKNTNYMKKFLKVETRKRLGKAGDNYLEQVDNVMERFSFATNISLSEIDRRKNLAEWIKSQEEQGLVPQIPEKLLNEAYRVSYKDMTMEEFQGVVDFVKNIEHLARLKNKLLKNAEIRDLEKAVDEAVASIVANSKGELPQDHETRLPGQEKKRGFKGFFESHRKMSNFFRHMDGWKDNGIMWNLFVRPMNEAGDREASMNEQAAESLGKIFNKFDNKELSNLYKKEFIPEINGSLTRAGQIMVALNYGNMDNRQKLMDGRNWSDAQLMAIISRLNRKELQIVQEVWDHINSYWAESEAMSKRVNGIAPAKVEAAPFTVRASDDKQAVEMKGGYFPLKYDDRLAPRAYANLAKETADAAMKGAGVRATTKQGHRKERVEGVKMPVRLDFGVIFEHVGTVIHDLTHYEYLIDTNKLLGNADIQKAIISHYGDQVYGQLRDGMMDIAAGQVGAQTSFEKGINWLRSGSSVAGMGWNLMTSLQQPLGLSQSIVRVGAKWIGKGVARWIGDAIKMENTTKMIHEKSELMRLRAKTQSREINEIRNQLEDKSVHIGPLTIKMGPIEDSYFYMIGKAQMIADVPTWLGAYEKALEEIKGEELSADELDKKAVALADQAVLDSQGGGQVKDLAQIQRGGPLLKLWTNFYSVFNTTYNLTREAVGKTDFKNPYEVGRLAVDMFFLYSVPAILGFGIRAAVKGGDDDDPEELAKKLAMEQLNYMMGTMVGVREISAAVSGFSGYQGPAGTRFFSQFGELTKQASQGEADAAFLKALNQSAGTMFHYPATQVEKTAKGISALVEGETQNPAALLFGPPKK